MTKGAELNQRIVNCKRCPRLLDHCQKIANVKRRAYIEDDYWGRPVPNFGPQKAPLLIVGLAPGAHGANRTGRMFTGDRSGDWLYRALHRAGFCNQSNSNSLDDGLRLKRCLITAVCHCAPPDNKPTGEEISCCSDYLLETIQLCRPQTIVALGGIAFNAVARHAIENGWLQAPRPKFGHAVRVEMQCGRRSVEFIGCYHPSQQNTFTGKLTEAMLDDLFGRISREQKM